MRPSIKSTVRQPAVGTDLDSLHATVLARQGSPTVPRGPADRRKMLAPPTTRPSRRARVTRGRAVMVLVVSLVVLLSGLLATTAFGPGSGSSVAPAVAVQPLPNPTDAPTLPPCDSTVPLQLCAPASTTSTTPCSGEGCIPQPGTTTAVPTNPGEVQPGQGAEPELECGVTDIAACFTIAINGFFRDLVMAAISPVLDLLGRTVLSTPTIDSLPGISELWHNSFGLVVAIYGLFVLVGGIVVMSYQSIQTRYSIKEIGPRIPIAFLASTLSLFFADKFIELANALTLGVLGGGVNPPSLGDTLSDAIQGIQSGGLFIILIGLILLVVGIGLLIVYVVRVVITLILIISGPLFLMCHALPHTEPLARWWWKAIAAVLAIQIAQTLVLITAVHTFMSSGVHVFGSTLSALGMMVAAIALFYILFKIPFWLLATVKVSSGRSFLGGLAKAYIAAKTFGMVAGKTGAVSKTAAAGAARGSGGTGPGRGGGRAEAADPSWPVQPRLAPTPAMVSTRLRQAHDTERARAARRSRLPSQAPRFLQPIPQQTTHDPAVTPTPHGPTTPEFSSAPNTTTPPPSAPGQHRPAPAPQFHAPGAHRGSDHQAARPIRMAPVPPHLQFTAPGTQPAHPSQPVKPSAPPPGAPVFRQAHPAPRIGDARPRTPAVPPVTFRAPTPPPSRGSDPTP